MPVPIRTELSAPAGTLPRSVVSDSYNATAMASSRNEAHPKCGTRDDLVTTYASWPQPPRIHPPIVAPMWPRSARPSDACGDAGSVFDSAGGARIVKSVPAPRSLLLD